MLHSLFHYQAMPWNAQHWRRLILVKIPSLHSKSTSYPVIIQYVPHSAEMDENQIHNPLGFTAPGYRRIMGWSCQSDKCKPGYRLAGCCSHVAAALVLFGCYAHDETEFKTFARPAPYLDIRHPNSLNKELLGTAPNQ